MRRVSVLGVCAGIIVAAMACGGKSGGAAPTPVVDPKLTAPALDTPSDGEQLDTLRPTLVVKNGTSDQAGTRTYEFQISDCADFSTAGSTQQIPSFFSTVDQSGVAENTSGKTSFAVDHDLQPTTRFYWRARMTQGKVVSDWSAVGKFRSRLVGFNRAGALYDPLIHGETVGTIVGSATFIPGKGIKLNNGQS